MIALAGMFATQLESAGLVRLDLPTTALRAPNGDPFYLLQPDEAHDLAEKLRRAAMAVEEAGR